MQKRVVLIGGGGHASDVLAAYEAQARHSGRPHSIIGLLDDEAIDERRFAHRGIGQIGGVADLDSVGASHFIIAAGWPEQRRKIWSQINKTPLKADTIVHPLANVPPGVLVGGGSVILAMVSCSELASIGEHAYLSHGCLIGHDTQIGNFVSIMPGASVSGDVRIGDNSLIGANATILQGLRVGAGATVGAGSVATRNVEAGTIVTGIPARVKAFETTH